MDKYRAGLQQRPANFAPLTPISFLERSARVYPEKPAIIDGERRISYREMFGRCRAAADALRKAGIGSLDTVSVFAPNGVAMLEMHFAAPMAGAVLNAINFRLDAPTVAFILEHAESKVFLFDAELGPVAREALAQVKRPLTVVEIAAPNHPAKGDVLEYEAFIASGDPEGRIDWPAEEWRAISLNYTSGTTGNPKGVVCHHRGAYLNALGQGLEVGLSAGSVYLWTLPMFHCNGWTFTWGVTAAGGTHVVQRAVVPAEIFDKIERHGVTHLCGAPTVLSMLAFAPGSDSRRLKQKVTITTGGAAPTSTVIGAMEKMGFVVMHAYGLTETYGPATLCELQPEWQALELAEKAKLIARQGVRYVTAAGLAVLDPETGAMLPADGETLGEVCMRGNTVMMGYLKNPDASDAAFRDGWFHSGDLGVMHPDGYVEVKDRSKDIIISGGENISSLEVEEIMSRHPAIREVAVVAKPDGHWGETPCAFVTLRDGVAAPSGDELMAWCKQNMAHFKRPHYVVFGELPKTVTGKVQKYLLRERAKGM
ncbi:MAG TPA: AMP-binding protein [Dongiaceae bacterium]|nr:AMP-binding protein [Dongiaceae bacterium]